MRVTAEREFWPSANLSSDKVVYMRVAARFRECGTKRGQSEALPVPASSGAKASPSVPDDSSREATRALAQSAPCLGIAEAVECSRSASHEP